MIKREQSYCGKGDLEITFLDGDIKVAPYE